MANHWNTLKISLLGQTTKQPKSNFEPKKSWKYKQRELEPAPSCLYKIVILFELDTFLIGEGWKVRGWQVPPLKITL